MPRNGKTIGQRCDAMGFKNADTDELFHDVLDMLEKRTELLIKVQRSEDETLQDLQGMTRQRDVLQAKFEAVERGL